MVQIVLIKPEIPQNTGSIARTCAATRVPLHLVEPLGFEISEKRVRRAGLDYWPLVSLHQHQDWQSCLKHIGPKRSWFFTSRAEQPYWDIKYDSQDLLVFGCESAGLGASFLKSIPTEFQLQIPIYCPQVRSLNLSNAVSIVLYEALRQTAHQPN